MIGIALDVDDAAVVLLALDAADQWATADEAERAAGIAQALRAELRVEESRR